MASALPVSKGHYQTLEGTPTRGGPDDDEYIPPPPPPPNSNGSVINNQSLPPPPPDMDNMANSFDFDQWLNTNNLTKFKQIFIKHNMTTFNAIDTSNSKFALLISEQAIIESNTISSLVLAIQKLHFNPDTLRDPNDQQSEPSPASMYIPPIPAERQGSRSVDNKQIIVVSQEEHEVLTQLKQSLHEVQTIKSQLTRIQNEYSLNKNKVENNKKVYIEKCKEKINTTFFKNTNKIPLSNNEYADNILRQYKLLLFD